LFRFHFAPRLRASVSIKNAVAKRAAHSLQALCCSGAVDRGRRLARSVRRSKSTVIYLCPERFAALPLCPVPAALQRADVAQDKKGVRKRTSLGPAAFAARISTRGCRSRQFLLHWNLRQGESTLFLIVALGFQMNEINRRTGSKLETGIVFCADAGKLVDKKEAARMSGEISWQSQESTVMVSFRAKFGASGKPEWDRGLVAFRRRRTRAAEKLASSTRAC